MSQQSNPATLRELATEIDEIADALFSTNALRGRQLRNIAMRVKRAALAASGTEAALCEVCNAPREIAGGEHVCGLSASEAYSLGFARGINSQPAQAAASPEGEGRAQAIADMRDYCLSTHEGWPIAKRYDALRREGREASGWPSGRPVPAEDCYIAWCRWDGRGYVICDSDAPKAFKVYSWAALRQSAAPSGGDLREKVRKWREDALNESKSDNEWDATAARGRFYAYDNVWAALAPESKTGAVTERRDGK